LTARWMVPSWSKRAKAHLTHPHPLGTEYEWWACGGMGHQTTMLPDDGRARCKRCEAMRKRAKEGGC